MLFSYHYLGLNSVGKEVRNMGVDKCKNAVQIKPAFAFFDLQKGVTDLGDVSFCCSIDAHSLIQ